MSEPVRPQKITFADMRAQGVHGLLTYCADYRCSTRSQSAATTGPMISGCPTLSRGSSEQSVASMALTVAPPSSSL
jgi:hypothetical protein